MRADVTAVPLADGCADVVAAGEILEHVTDLPAAVAEACRLLRPGGLLVIDTLAATALARFVAVRLAERVPGGPPPGIHDPALLVDRGVLRRECARHGVPLRLRGIRPSLVDLARWLAGRTDGADGAGADHRRAVPGCRPARPPGGGWLTGGRQRVRRRLGHRPARAGGPAGGHVVGPLRRPLRGRPGGGADLPRGRGAAPARRGEPVAEDVSGWSTGARMRRYLTEALPLGKEAVDAALADAGLRAEDVGLFAVASCTGYATPGLDIRIAADLGMAPACSGWSSGTWGATRRCPGWARSPTTW